MKSGTVFRQNQNTFVVEQSEYGCILAQPFPYNYNSPLQIKQGFFVGQIDEELFSIKNDTYEDLLVNYEIMKEKLSFIIEEDQEIFFKESLAKQEMAIIMFVRSKTTDNGYRITGLIEEGFYFCLVEIVS